MGLWQFSLVAVPPGPRFKTRTLFVGVGASITNMRRSWERQSLWRKFIFSWNGIFIPKLPPWCLCLRVYVHMHLRPDSYLCVYQISFTLDFIMVIEMFCTVEVTTIVAMSSMAEPKIVATTTILRHWWRQLNFRLGNFRVPVLSTQAYTGAYARNTQTRTQSDKETHTYTYAHTYAHIH